MDLKRLREMKGWTQQHLADAMGVSIRTVQRIEVGKRPSKETAMAIQATLGPTDDAPNQVLCFDKHPTMSILEECEMVAGGGPRYALDGLEGFDGCAVSVYKNNIRVPFIHEINARTREVTRNGSLLLDLLFTKGTEEFSKRVSYESPKEYQEEVFKAVEDMKIENTDDLSEKVLENIDLDRLAEAVLGRLPKLDGEPYDAQASPVTITYDAVVIEGPPKVIQTLRDEDKVPKHWVLMETEIYESTDGSRRSSE